MAWVDDFSFTLANGNVRHTGGATRYPVIDMHRGLQDLAYQATKSGDDQLDITDLIVPSRRNSDTDIELLTFQNAGTQYINIDATAAEFMFGGSVTQESATGQERYSGLAIAGNFDIDPSCAPDVIQNNAKLTNYWGQSESPDAALGYAVRILVLSRTAGADIDGGRVRVQSRGYGFDYREGSTVLGRNESVAAVGNIASDPFNQTAQVTIDGLVGISNTEGYQGLDVNSDTVNEFYYSQWANGGNTNNQVYERIKSDTEMGSTTQFYGLDGELFRGVTHSITYDGLAGGNFTEGGATPITFGNGATGQVLADDTTNSIVHIQLLTGLPPTDNDSMTQGGVTASVNVTVTPRALGINSVLGNFTGSWQGAYGVGFVPGQLGATDQVTALDGVNYNPPNNQQVIVNNCINGETYVIIGKDDGTGLIDKDEYSAAAGNNVGNGTLVVQEAITNVPNSGTVRINNGVGDDLYEYTSFSGSTFTLVGTLSQTYSTGADVYVTIIDQLADAVTLTNSWIYTVDTDLVGQALDSGGTPNRQFPISGTFGATGFTVGLVNTPDT